LLKFSRVPADTAGEMDLTTWKLRLCRACTRATDQRGFTLIEVLVTLSIMGIVLGGLTATLSSAAGLEADLTKRFQGEQSARLALTKFRREAHCASVVTPTSGATTSVTLTLPTGCVTGTGSVTWCTSANGGRFDLWRVPGTTCTTTASGAARAATSLTSANAFTPDATVHGSAALPSVAVNFSVWGGTYTYLLTDVIYLRNGTRQ
jgi:prepilin-type N-terminal cleavage/methylation domain-containing protein